MSKKSLVRRSRRNEKGAAVAEYAAVTVAAIALGFVLVHALNGALGNSLIGKAFDLVLSFIA